MIEDSIPLDFQTFFTYFLVLGILGLVGYVLYNTVGSGKKGFNLKAAISSPIETGTVSSGTNEYVADSNVSSWKKLTGSQGKKPKK